MLLAVQPAVSNYAYSQIRTYRIVCVKGCIKPCTSVFTINVLSSLYQCEKLTELYNLIAYMVYCHTSVPATGECLPTSYRFHLAIISVCLSK